MRTFPASPVRWVAAEVMAAASAYSTWICATETNPSQTYNDSGVKGTGVPFCAGAMFAAVYQGDRFVAGACTDDNYNVEAGESVLYAHKPSAWIV